MGAMTSRAVELRNAEALVESLVSSAQFNVNIVNNLLGDLSFLTDFKNLLQGSSTNIAGDQIATDAETNMKMIQQLIFADVTAGGSGAVAMYNDAKALSARYPDDKKMIEKIQGLTSTIRDAVDVGRIVLSLSDVITSYFKSLAYTAAVEQAVKAQDAILTLMKNEQDDGAIAALYDMFIKATEEASTNQSLAVSSAQNAKTKASEALSLVHASSVFVLPASNLQVNKLQLLDLVETVAQNASLAMMADGGIDAFPATSLSSSQQQMVVQTRMRGLPTTDEVTDTNGNGMIDKGITPAPAGTPPVFNPGTEYTYTTEINSGDFNLDSQGKPQYRKLIIETTMKEPGTDATGWVVTKIYRTNPWITDCLLYTSPSPRD